MKKLTHPLFNKLKQPEIWPYLVTSLLLVLAITLPLTWFPADHLLLRGDPMYPFDPVRYLHDQLSLWPGKWNLGSDYGSITVAQVPLLFIGAIPGLLGASDRVGEIFHFTLWFVLPGFAIALFIQALTDRLKVNKWAMPVAVAYYLFNLYRLVQFGDNNHLLIYTAIPLSLYLLTLALDKDKAWLPPIVGFALMTVVISRAATNPPMYLMFILSVVLYGGVLTLMEWRSWRRSLRVWLSLFALAALANLFWMVPFYIINSQMSGLGSAGNLNWLNDLSKSTSPEHVIRLIGAWDWFDTWRGEPYAPYAAIYSQPLWQWLTLLPAILALLPFLFRRGYNSYLLSILVLGLIGLAFSLGTHPPFTDIFNWCVRHLPFFWSFRSPWYKFSTLPAFAFAVLIGIGVAMLIDWLTKTRLRFVLAPVLLAIIILPLVIAHPFITGSRWLKPQDVSTLAPDTIPYPTHIRQAADWLNAQPGNTGVALLPYQGAAIFRWGLQTNVDPIYYMSRRPVFYRGDRIGYVVGETPGASLAYQIFVHKLYEGDPTAEHVARLLGIEYIIERKDINTPFYDDTDDPAFVTAALEKQANIHKVRSFGEWDIYRLENVEENAVYATDWSVFIDDDPRTQLDKIVSETVPGNPYPAILYSRPTRPAQASREVTHRLEAAVADRLPAPRLSVQKDLEGYTVTGTSDHPFLLVFNQTYDSGWKARSHNASIGPRAVANGYAPVWLVEPQGEFSIRINYQPQKLVVSSAAISLTVLLLALGVLLAGWRSTAFRDKINLLLAGSLTGDAAKDKHD